MNWNIVEGEWKQFKGEVETQRGKLTDDHLDVIADKHTELASNIQETCGITHDEVEAQIKHGERRDKDEHPADSRDTVRLGETGYSSPGCACPRCKGMATRVPRRLVDLLASMFISVSRYRCRSEDCGWVGNLRVKRHTLLIKFP